MSSIMEQARALFQDQHPHEAISLAEANQESIDECDLLWIRAVCTIDIGFELYLEDIEAARELLEQGLELCERSLACFEEETNEDHLTLLLFQSDALQYLQQSEEAIFVLERALDLSGLQLNAKRNILSRLASLYTDLGRLDDAVEAIRDSIAITEKLSEDPDALTENDRALQYITLAQALTLQGKKDEADWAIQQTRLRLAKQLPDYHNVLMSFADTVDLFIETFYPDREAEKLDLYTELIFISPYAEVRAQYISKKGVVLYKLQSYDEALTNLLQAIEEDPAHSIQHGAHLYAGLAAVHTGHLNLAERHLQFPLPNELDPGIAGTVNLYRAETAVGLGKLRQAKEIFQQVLHDPNATDEQQRRAMKRLKDLKL